MGLSANTVKLLEDEYDNPLRNFRAAPKMGTLVPAKPTLALVAALEADTVAAGVPATAINWTSLLGTLFTLLGQYGPTLVQVITAIIGAFGSTTTTTPVVPPPGPAQPSSPVITQNPATS